MSQTLPARQPARLGPASHRPDVTPDLACVTVAIVNCFLVGRPGAGDRDWALVDTAVWPSAGRIRRAAAARFAPGARPAAIILTHGHFDHVGDLAELADGYDAPVYAHELELPYLTGRSSYPPPDPAVGGGAMAFLSRLYPRGPIDLGGRVRPLPADGSVPGMPGWRWVHTPGHTAGHVSLFRDADRALIAGDAFVTQKQESAWAVLTQQPREVRRPPAYYTTDWEASRRSVEALAALRPELAVTGHGLPMSGEPLRRGLEALLRDWGRVAVPPQGRYVNQPAVTDERGVVSVPPAVTDPQLVKLACATAAVTAVGLLLRATACPRR